MGRVSSVADASETTLTVGGSIPGCEGNKRSCVRGTAVRCACLPHGTGHPQETQLPRNNWWSGALVLSRAQFHSVVICGGGDVVGMPDKHRSGGRLVGTQLGGLIANRCPLMPEPEQAAT